MKTVKQVSALTGVSVRTLHHYDAIGLLRPSQVTPAGYRLYDQNALQRLHCILLLKQLQFSLKDIQQILDKPAFDPMHALDQQIHLLELQKQHLEDLILHARQIQKTGVIPMDFSTFNTDKINRYAAEAKEKWGSTAAYREFEEKANIQSDDEQKKNTEALMDIFRAFGSIRHLPAYSPKAQALAAQLQMFITAHYYNCTKQILLGLGQMYAAPGEMNENIDHAGGLGTGRFVCDVIAVYCK